jgi:2-hydroxychromene-2-carboxylate isomerase
LAYKRLQQVSKKYDVDIQLEPVLLGGIFQGASNQSPAVVPLKATWMDIDMKRYADRFGVPFKQNEFFPINTITLMRGAIVALETGCFDHYVETVYDAMWCESKNLADMEILIDVLTSADLDAKTLLEGTQQAHIKDDLKQRTTAALERGLFGCPTLFYISR